MSAWISKAALLAAVLTAAGPVQAETCGPLAPPRPAQPVAESWSVATQNLWRLLDSRGRAGAEPPPSAEQVQARIDALAEYVDQRLGYPHLLLVQEVENRGLLEALATRIRQNGGPRYYVWLMEGQDPSGIDVGALSRAPVRIKGMEPLFASARHDVHWLFSRPPLLLNVVEPVAMDVLVLHLRSGRGLDDPDRGAGVQAKRQAQARKVARWVTARRQAGHRVLVAGDINSAPDQGVFSEPLDALLQAPLVSAWDRLPETDRYSYVYRCRPQAIDHMLLTDNLVPLLRDVQVTRGNAGRYQALHQSGGTEVISDHDSLMIWLALPGQEEKGRREE